MQIPWPPRNDDDFRRFYASERRAMTALVIAMGGYQIHDPEQTAENGWHGFYPHWRDCRNPRAYLRTCIANAARNELRAARKAPPAAPVGTSATDFMAAGWHPEAAGAAPGPDRAADPDPALAAAIGTLSAKLRAVVVLDTELEPGQRSAAEIGQILGISRVTAAMRLKRAYTRLAQLLPGDYPGQHPHRSRAAADLDERPAT